MSAKTWVQRDDAQPKTIENLAGLGQIVSSGPGLIPVTSVYRIVSRCYECFHSILGQSIHRFESVGSECARQYAYRNW
jgi:hypothetical protein